ncbi:MAG: hypothetical protein ACTHYS_03695 [Ancrocorticia populi]|uniref:hypothetical protein n=1 Tax=Ancrocorticia populi TaxID=2175228 RepID=UPI003F90EA92
MTLARVEGYRLRDRIGDLGMLDPAASEFRLLFRGGDIAFSVKDKVNAEVFF